MWRNRFRWIPLIGGLVDCTVNDHWDSAKQMAVITGLSTAPLWLASLMVFGSGDQLDFAAFKAAVQSPIAHGELYMYCTALLAPIFWIALVDPRGARREFPSRLSHMFLIAIIDLVSAFCFGALASGKSMNPHFTLVVSSGMFVASVVLLYIGTVYHVHQVPNVRDELRKQENDFFSAYRGHRQ